MRIQLNFMRILADLGFNGVYPIYWIKKVKHAIGYILSKYACTRLSRTKRTYNLDKIPRKPRAHTKGVTPKDCLNYIK